MSFKNIFITRGDTNRIEIEVRIFAPEIALSTIYLGAAAKVGMEAIYRKISNGG
jgi:hypothetical protein